MSFREKFKGDIACHLGGRSHRAIAKENANLSFMFFVWLDVNSSIPVRK